MTLDQATRLWDIMVFEGDAILVRAGVALLGGLEGRLFGVVDQSGFEDVLRGGVSVHEEEWIQSVKGAGKSGGLPIAKE